jgi:hypothetical protein
MRDCTTLEARSRHRSTGGWMQLDAEHISSYSMYIMAASDAARPMCDTDQAYILSLQGTPI